MGFLDKLFRKHQDARPQMGSIDLSDSYEQLAERAINELQLKTSAHDGAWRLGEASWAIDQNAGTITFTSPKGIVATCDVQIIGTYNTDDGSWLWGWDHPSVIPPLDKHAKSAFSYGQQREGHTLLTTLKLAITEQQAWELAAIACHLTAAQGAYRCPSGPTMVFVTFDDVKLSGTDKTDASSLQPEIDCIEPDLPADQVPKEILGTVEGYIRDYAQWNQDALDAGDMMKLNAAAEKSIEDGHKTLVAKWYSSQTIPQPYSYGTDSSHDPTRESIQGASLSGDTAIVFTRHTDAHGFISDYEYHLLQEKDGWKLRHLIYVDEDGKYECL